MMKLSVLKIAISLVLVVAGLVLAVNFAGQEKEESATGIIIDFGDYSIVYGHTDKDSNASEALDSVCADNEYPIVYDGDGNVKSINGQPSSGDTRTWHLYTLNSSNNWVLRTGDASDVKIDSETAVAWGLCDTGETPTTPVDSAGHSYYDLGTAKRIVCLAPSCTETVCALGGEDLIVGTDRYSNYPISVEQKRNAGIIAETGSYTSPSYETILKLNPDLVIGISSQYNHKVVVNKLREVGINAILVGDGEDLKTVYDNTYMTGVAMGLGTKATDLTLKLKEQVEQIYGIVATTSERPTVMVSLSADKSPWVSGVNTYVSDIYGKSGAVNAFGSDVDGWRQINSEAIVQTNPSVIIVISSEKATQANYDSMLANLSSEWKSTDAYKNGKIYMVCDSAADMMSRPSTRLAQVTEILARMFHEDSFTDVISIPMFFGDDYTDYLTYSKTL